MQKRVQSCICTRFCVTLFLLYEERLISLAFDSYTVTQEESSLTVRDFLKSHHISARQIQKLTRSKGILKNGRPAFLNASLRVGDSIKIRRLSPAASKLTAENLPLDILYEDEYLIAVNKPPRQLVHPTGHTTSGTLANAIAYHLQESGQPLILHPIHRLDRDTSGCVLFAKTAEAQRSLTKQRDDHTLTRTYQAIVNGIPEQAEGTIKLPIGKHPTQANRRMIHKDGDNAVTHYRVLSSYDNHSLVELTLETGRTHQIRLHLAAISLPIIGDNMYGMRSPFIRRQALHAVRTTFLHPYTAKQVTIDAPLTEDIRNALRMTEL